MTNHFPVFCGLESWCFHFDRDDVYLGKVPIQGCRKAGDVMKDLGSGRRGPYPEHILKKIEKVNDRRSRGPVSLCKRQPVEGMKRDGGLRIGEMEKNAFLDIRRCVRRQDLELGGEPSLELDQDDPWKCYLEEKKKK